MVHIHKHPKHSHTHHKPEHAHVPDPKHIDRLDAKDKEQRTATMQKYRQHDNPQQPPHSMRESTNKHRERTIPPWAGKQKQHRGRG